MINADYHVHSDYSSDGTAPPEQMIKQAIRLGLKRICFTDHMDYDYPQVSDYSFVFGMEDYQEELRSLREQYSSQISILTGVELGLQPHITDRMNSLVQNCPLDFVIGSTHVVDRVDPYYPEYWEGISQEEGIRRYFQAILDNVRSFDGFHVCGHIDYIIRYTPTTMAHKSYLRADMSVPENKLRQAEAYAEIYSLYRYETYAELLDEVLQVLLSKGKGIEVNTSGLRHGLKYAHPRTEILKRYKELGGELITIGSDAHSPEYLGFGFRQTSELLKSLGYRYYAVFQQGKPVMELL